MSRDRRDHEWWRGKYKMWEANCAIEAAIYQSNPWAGAMDWRKIGRIFILFSNFGLARGDSSRGRNSCFFFSFSPCYKPCGVPGCPSTLNEKGCVKGTALHDEGMVLETPSCDLAVAVGAESSFVKFQRTCLPSGVQFPPGVKWWTRSSIADIFQPICVSRRMRDIHTRTGHQ